MTYNVYECNDCGATFYSLYACECKKCESEDIMAVAQVEG